VPVSSSLASNGPPANAPISTGTSWIKMAQAFPSGQSFELKLLNSCWQACDSFCTLPTRGHLTMAA
jgi:hypothetical protein